MNQTSTLAELEPSPPSSSSRENISQSEVEQLLTQVETVGALPPGADPEAPAGLAGPDIIQRHDFPKLSQISSAELRPLRVRHDDFICALTTRLSIHLGLEIGMQLSKLETMPFQKFTEGLSNPTYLTMLKLQPLAGICVLDIPPRLGLCFVDRELGGLGRVEDETRPIGKIEARLLSAIASLIVNEWGAIWSDLMEIKSAVLGHEISSRYLQTSTPETTMLVVGIEVRIAEIVEQMQFAFPHSMLEPLTLKLNSGAADGEKRDAAAKVPPVKWNSLFDELQIQVKAELPEIHLSAGEVADLKPGDILNLSPECMNEVRLRLANHPGFLGTLGSSNQRRAVKIDKCLKS
jgi:flagellar motor switch protein FliM